MINEVRNTVLSILNKDNNGYLTPEQFNLYAASAQNEIFEQINYDYSNSVNKRNSHQHTSGLGDVTKRLAEVINSFRHSTPLSYNPISLHYEMPSDVFSFGVISTVLGEVVEPVQQHDLLKLLSSIDTAPTSDYPIYTIHNLGSTYSNPVQIKVYPTSIVNTGQVIADYIRYPKTPKWTYLGLTAGEPVFNQSAADYQDFELPASYKMDLIVKILGYSGVMIRDEDVVKSAKAEEIQEKQEQR